MINIKSVAVLGVDGTGKSTVVRALQDYFGAERTVVQYMGLKDWETFFARVCYNHPWTKLFGRLARLAVLRELCVRVRKHDGSKKIVIFDRYVDEQVLQFKKYKLRLPGKIMQVLYKRTFGPNFYRPTISFYMTCNLEVSISRKDDINTPQDIERLKLNKTLMDDFYKGKAGVVTIDTSNISIEDTLQIIFKKMEEMKCFNI